MGHAIRTHSVRMTTVNLDWDLDSNPNLTLHVWILSQGTSNSYNMAMRALADLSPEGNKKAKHLRGAML